MTCLQGPERENGLRPSMFSLARMTHTECMVFISRTKMHEAKIFRPIWAYINKGSSVHNAWKCMNDKQIVQMGVKFGNIYVTCIAHHCLRLFVALSAYRGNIIEDGDVVNAYTHIDTEGTHIYIVVDDVYQSWHNSPYGSQVSIGACVPLHNAMQGHSKSGQ
jgi:hypothetical protein